MRGDESVDVTNVWCSYFWLMEEMHLKVDVKRLLATLLFIMPCYFFFFKNIFWMTLKSLKNNLI